MADLPTVVTQAGLLPQAPADLHDQLLAAAVLLSPGLTGRLPGTLIEDIASTDVAAVVLCDSARVETIDSLTPRGANAYLLAQLGEMFGISQAAATNTSVQVVFVGPPGFVVPNGFLVSDMTYTYACTGGIIGAGGQSDPLSCIAVTSGSWTIPPGTVTEVVTSVADPAVVTCSNPYPGTPGLLSETEGDYRIRVLDACRAAGQGTPSYFRTLVENVPGVQPRLVSFQQVAGGGWKAIVGGGDVYGVANAIYRAVLDTSTLTGSVMAVTSITSGSNGVVTTLLNHGYTTGQVVYLTGVLGMTGINSLPLTITVLDQKTFQVNRSTSLMGAYTSGGVLTPNFRNNSVAVRDYPDSYTIAFISPPQQTVAITALWGTTAVNFINDGAIAQLAAPALAAVVNAVPVGQPLNIYDLEEAFREAVLPIMPSTLLTRMVFSVSINGIGTAPDTGTGAVRGDPESYFSCDPTGLNITVLRG
jgi:hypothetical protein